MKSSLLVSGWCRTGFIGVWLIVVGTCFHTEQAGGQSLSGMTGLYHIPTAEIPEDKTVIIGFNRLPKEYTAYGQGEYNSLAGFVSVTFLPRLEVMFRYTYQLGREDRGPGASIFMDRMIGARLLLLRENDRRPALLAGMHDPGEFTGLAVNTWFGSNYLATTKNVRVGVLQSGLHLGAAFDLPGHRSRVHRGLFGGVSLSHGSLEWVEVIGEYDTMRINAAVRVLLLDRVQLLAGLRGLDRFSGGVSVRFGL